MPFAVGNAHQLEPAPSPTTGHIFGGHHLSPSPCHRQGQLPLNQGAQRPIHLPQHPVFRVISSLGHPTDAPSAFPKLSPNAEFCCCPTQVIWGLQTSSGPFMCWGWRLVAITELCICLTSQSPQSPPCPLATLVLLLHF